jgi:hypothetical protein
MERSICSVSFPPEDTRGHQSGSLSGERSNCGGAVTSV